MIEAQVYPDYIHIPVSIPPYLSPAQFIVLKVGIGMLI